MTRSDAEHHDVASYALGVLDAPDAARFEDHLIQCDRCAAELESFLPVTSLLADVDGEEFLAAEASLAGNRMLDEMVAEVSHERARVRSRRVFSLAAGVVALAAAAGIGLYAGTLTGGAGAPQAQPSPNQTLGEGQSGFLDGVPAVRAVDPTTKVNAAVRLAERPWGTAIAMDLRNLKGPLKCQLVAVGNDGLGEVVSTWTVDREGYGTAANQKALQLAGSTAIKRADIDRMEVQSVADGGRPGLIVSVDV
ncbi:RNA polymerase subunit sigma [Pilimelia anulata]|uniref:RNA polymerase subunit sigma n=1 Tax=Pilimelia anulata TaxID=53371 RepID=A0A8J3F8E8_9ACTN|nr:zf-HC2 domain-containing protein [Pilimelia anulata]GGJ77629.1 RNA polymerase subunit sigma [Pilimelia anulata]